MYILSCGMFEVIFTAKCWVSLMYQLCNVQSIAEETLKYNISNSTSYAFLLSFIII